MGAKREKIDFAGRTFTRSRIRISFAYCAALGGGANLSLATFENAYYASLFTMVYVELEAPSDATVASVFISALFARVTRLGPDRLNSPSSNPRSIKN